MSLTCFSGSLSNEEGIQKSNETIPVFSDVSAMETKQDETEEPEHDVPYFRFLLILVHSPVAFPRSP